MTILSYPLGPWQSWHPDQVADFFADIPVQWWISGGWAVDLFVGRQTRAHDDIDVQFAGSDQQALRQHFRDWDVQAATPNHRPRDWPFHPWKLGTPLSPEVHDIWCRPTAGDPWVMQLMVAEVREGEWYFRRDARIHRAVTTIGGMTNSGISYLAPEIQILYKAKGRRPKDETDFNHVLPDLDLHQCQWLADALALIHPGHPWLARLK